MATVIIGLGVVALLELLAAGTVSNVRGTEMTTGISLAKNIRELALQKTFDELPSLNNVTYNPAVDSRGVALSDAPGWTQTVTVAAVDPNLLTATVSSTAPQARRVTASVTHNGRKVCDLEWYSFDGAP